MNKEFIPYEQALELKELVSESISYQDAINTWIFLKLAELF